MLTALAEIVGCSLPSLGLKQQGSAWLLVPAACSLALFAWLLSLHPTAAGRVSAAYGGVDITVALLWLWLVGSVPSTVRGCGGRGGCLCGRTLPILGAHPSLRP